MTAPVRLVAVREMAFPISAPLVYCDRIARVLQTSVSARGALSVGSNAERRMYERLAARRRRTPPTPPIRHIAIVQEPVVPNTSRRLLGDDRVRSVMDDTANQPNSEEFVDRIRRAATQRLLFLPHAIRQMTRPDRMIEPIEVREVVMQGELIEDYPEDMRGHSGLIHGKGKHQRDIHVVCAPKEYFLAIITAYIPYRDEWEQDFRTRRRR